MTVKCPQCDFKNPDDIFYCGKCATPLKPSKDISITKTLHTPLASPGKTIAGKYKILSELGRGGMGVVYKAKDTRLKRTVALKFLPAELTKEKEAKKRFIQEAQAAAALEHPNICTVYEVDEADGQTFIAMSYIEGQSLKARLKDGPLDIDEAKDIALLVAEGLKEANEKGIVHRDIKPANIMLTKKGQAKITDFGLAKLSWGVNLTKTSTVMGTVAYMSPEQARGEEVDPKPISAIRTDNPSYLEQTINKALMKNLDERYQTIQELLDDLRLSAFTTIQKTEKSIVVLPFDDMSPGRDNEYFCDGITEEIISDLSQIHDLLVISRSSAMTYKGASKKINEIRKELNVQYVLEGSVRKAGNNLRITAQLIETKTDAHLWAEKYSGTLDDVFDIQEKVSRKIVKSLKMRLSPKEDQKLAERPIDNALAYEFYLKATQEIWRFSEEALERAIQLLQKGLEITGDNALLYSGLAWAYYQYVNMGAKQEDYIAKSEEYTKKALSLDPDNPKANLVLASIHAVIEGNQEESVRQTKKVLADFPNDPEAVRSLAYLYSFNLGKITEATPQVERLKQIDPLNPMTHLIEGALYFFNAQYDLALKPFQSFNQSNPGNPSLFYYAWTLAYNNMHDECNEILDQIAKATGDNAIINCGLLLGHALKKDRTGALQAMTADFIKTSRRDPPLSHFVGVMMAILDEKDEAINWLENAVDQGFLNYPLLAEKDPWLENIRGEPRFKKLMERVKHEWENFEV